MPHPHAPLLALTILAALATGACGRIALPAPSVPAPVSERQPMAKDLPGAVAAARLAMKDPDAKPLTIAAYGVTDAGKLADSIRSGWVLGMQPTRGDVTKPKLVALYWDGDTRVTSAKPSSEAQGPALMPTVLPPMRQSIAWARSAGMKKAATYQIVYMADAEGPLVAVAERTPVGGDPLADSAADPDRKVMILDASTGKSLLAAVPAPTVAEAPEPDSAEGATAMTMMASSLRARR